MAGLGRYGPAAALFGHGLYTMYKGNASNLRIGIQSLAIFANMHLGWCLESTVVYMGSLLLEDFRW